MDKLVSFFKNVWFRRGVSVVCWGYTLFMIWVTYLSFGYYFEVQNVTALFVLYLFVNCAALGLMILSRKQVITQVNAYILPLIVLALTIFAFGNWYLILPPAVVMIVLFFVNRSNETLKVVLGTMFLLMFVIGIAGYIGLKIFVPDISFTGVDLTARDKSYEKMSKSGDYRIVRYFSTNGDNKLQHYYVESTEDDINIPFGVCKKVFGCKHINTSAYTDTPKDIVDWGDRTTGGKKTEIILVQGYVQENPYLIKEIDDETSSSGTSSAAMGDLITNANLTESNSFSS